MHQEHCSEHGFVLLQESQEKEKEKKKKEKKREENNPPTGASWALHLCTI